MPLNFADNDLLLTETAAVRLPLDDLDMDALRGGFSGLFDRAARAIQLQGLEQDDVVFDRFLLCECARERFEVAAEWLSDRDRLISSIRARASALPNRTDITIVELRVAVRQQSLPIRPIGGTQT